MAATLGTYNPFRYRHDVYDEETGLYDLRSRYYYPVWGRFICADSLLGKFGKLLSHNLFAYCGNNPVMQIDPSGNVPVALYLYTFAVGATSNEDYDFSNTPISAQLTRQFRRSLVMSDGGRSIA